MQPIVFNLTWLAGHFFVYALWLRRCPFLRRESAIFVYHSVSYALLLPLNIFLGAALWPQNLLDGLFLGAGLHGIYSLSFLEVWSLTWGSYSLGLLQRLAHQHGTATTEELMVLGALGTSKQQSRSLQLQDSAFPAPMAAPRGKGASWPPP